MVSNTNCSTGQRSQQLGTPSRRNQRSQNALESQLWAIALLVVLASASGVRGWTYKRIPQARNCFRVVEDGREFCVPSEFIVGLPKAGTSALYSKLGKHRNCCMGNKLGYSMDGARYR